MFHKSSAKISIFFSYEAPNAHKITTLPPIRTTTTHSSTLRRTNAYTRFKESIRLVGRAVAADDQEYWKRVIFEEQPYLSNVNLSNTRSIGIIFVVHDAEIEYFNLSVRPIFRECYTLGNATINPKGFVINADECIACGICATVCPQEAIDSGDTYHIRPYNCLHCGNCFEHCPMGAVQRL